MSADENRELLQLLAQLRGLFPEWRLGQLIANLATAAGATEAGAVWEVEDAQLLDAARRLVRQNSNRSIARV